MAGTAFEMGIVMRYWVILLGGLMMTGCAMTPEEMPTSIVLPAEEPIKTVIPGPAHPQPQESSALVFDPRLPEGTTVELARAPRERSAYVGYDELTTTYSYLRVDDRQRHDSRDGDHYERRAIIESIGVRVR